MVSGLLLAVALLTGCSSKPEQPQTAPAATTQANAKGGKVAKQGKGRKSAKGAKGKAKGGKARGARSAKTAKTGAPAQQPIGAEGPVLGELKLASAAPAEGAAEGEAAEAPAADKTKADLLLTFGEDGEATVELGEIKGTCAEIESVPVGPEGKQQTPLWTVRCTSGEAHTDLYILQVKNNLAVVREVPPKAEGQAATFRPVKRVPLAKGAELQRKG